MKKFGVTLAALIAISTIGDEQDVTSLRFGNAGNWPIGELATTCRSALGDRGQIGIYWVAANRTDKDRRICSRKRSIGPAHIADELIQVCSLDLRFAIDQRFLSR